MKTTMQTTHKLVEPNNTPNIKIYGSYRIHSKMIVHDYGETKMFDIISHIGMAKLIFLSLVAKSNHYKCYLLTFITSIYKGFFNKNFLLFSYINCSHDRV